MASHGSKFPWQCWSRSGAQMLRGDPDRWNLRSPWGRQVSAITEGNSLIPSQQCLEAGPNRRCSGHKHSLWTNITTRQAVGVALVGALMTWIHTPSSPEEGRHRDKGPTLEAETAFISVFTLDSIASAAVRNKLPGLISNSVSDIFL